MSQIDIKKKKKLKSSFIQAINIHKNNSFLILITLLKFKGETVSKEEILKKAKVFFKYFFNSKIIIINIKFYKLNDFFNEIRTDLE